MKTFKEFINEEIEPKLAELIKKHSLKSNKHGTRIEDHEWNENEGKDFNDANYHKIKR